MSLVSGPLSPVHNGGRLCQMKVAQGYLWIDCGAGFEKIDTSKTGMPKNGDQARQMGESHQPKWRTK